MRKVYTRKVWVSLKEGCNPTPTLNLKKKKIKKNNQKESDIFV